MTNREIELAKLRRAHIEAQNADLRRDNGTSRALIEKSYNDHMTLSKRERNAILANENTLIKNQEEYNKLGDQIAKHQKSITSHS
jgi:hypothetical protein